MREDYFILLFVLFCLDVVLNLLESRIFFSIFLCLLYIFQPQFTYLPEGKDIARQFYIITSTSIGMSSICS